MKNRLLHQAVINGSLLSFLFSGAYFAIRFCQIKKHQRNGHPKFRFIHTFNLLRLVNKNPEVRTLGFLLFLDFKYNQKIDTVFFRLSP